MDTVERITRKNIGDIVFRMSARHEKMMKWSRESQNELGGVFGAVQKAMGDTEVLPETSSYLETLLVHDELFFSEFPTCEHRGKTFSVVARKQRSLKGFISNAKKHLEHGGSLYLHSILWQPSYEVLGHVTEGFFMTRSAKFNWNNEEKK